MATVFEASAKGIFSGPNLQFRCAIGKGGMTNAAEKREGDGASPIGRWEMRRVMYRADKISAPTTRLPVSSIQPDDGWCDDPTDPAYNRPVTLPFAASHEKLWRQDNVYDIIVELGHNDDPPVPGLGSAIFLHVAQPDYAPTEGCIALSEEDLRSVLELAAPGSILAITADG